MSPLERIAYRADALASGAADGVVAHMRALMLEILRDLERELRRRYPAHLEAVAREATRTAQEYRARLLAEELRTLIAAMDLSAAGALAPLLPALLEAQRAGLSEALDYLERLSGSRPTFGGIDEMAARMALENSARRLRNYSQEAQQRITDAVARGLLSGQGVRKVAAAIRKEAVQPLLSSAETIAHTEVQSARLERRDAVYRAENIELVQWIATNDDRVCFICGPRHGLVFRREEVARVPHPRCRCTRVPWKAEWQRLGLTDDELWREQREEIRRELEARGEGFRLRLAPFEKSDGLSEPPRPVAGV